jgi:hypothetical protein
MQKYRAQKKSEAGSPGEEPETAPKTAQGTAGAAPQTDDSRKKLLDSFIGGLTEKPNTSSGGAVNPSGGPGTQPAPPVGQKPVVYIIPPHLFIMISKTLNRVMQADIYPTDEDTGQMLAESLAACMTQGSKPMNPWMGFLMACIIAYGLPTVLNIDIVMKRFKKADKNAGPNKQTGVLAGVFGPRDSKPTAPAPGTAGAGAGGEGGVAAAEALLARRDVPRESFYHGTPSQREDHLSPVDFRDDKATLSGQDQPPDGLTKRRGGALL